MSDGYKMIEARTDAQNALLRFGVAKPFDYSTLRKLLGKEPTSMLIGNMNEEDYSNCLLLASPHGYTIFKMLCLKHGLTEFANNCEDL